MGIQMRTTFIISKIEPHKTKNTAEQKTPALKQGVLQNYHFGSFEYGVKNVAE